MSYRALNNRLNGRLTVDGFAGCGNPKASGASPSYEDAKSQYGSNHWSSTENNRNNARNVNFNTGNTNNNNKYNSNTVRPVTAFDGDMPTSFLVSVWEAYHNCLKGKTSSRQALDYMGKAEEDIPLLAQELWSGTYLPGTSTCFLVKYPKWREVFAAGFRDRIVHHWICMRLEPLFELRFERQGNVSFNCRKGYGTEVAVKYVAEGMRRVSGNYRKKAWVFRGDLVGFFMSIDKELLWAKLEKFIRQWRKRWERDGWKGMDFDVLARLGMVQMPDMYWDVLLRTTETVVKHHPEKNCVLNSPKEWWRHLAPSKSLFATDSGMPIGNLTTQLFANFLMSSFVTYVQFLFRRTNYCFAQFVDDFVIVCDDLRFLSASIPRIEDCLQRLHLTLHKDKQYLQPVQHGLLFVGSFIKPGRLYLSNRTLARLKEHCEGFGGMLNGDISASDLEHVEQVMNSYLGFTRRRKTYKMRKEWLENMGGGFWRLFYVKGHFESVRLRKTNSPKHNLIVNC